MLAGERSVFQPRRRRGKVGQRAMAQVAAITRAYHLRGHPVGGGLRMLFEKPSGTQISLHAGYARRRQELLPLLRRTPGKYFSNFGGEFAVMLLARRLA